ncbi:hypothetical protein K1F50_15910 [Muricauda oceani]|uniref:Uncharacterized protein n=1 Tax=Flagellimonas oceani TaxID=2698672 RepID=A0A6G7J097_9FLAO|nr:hypothetical protein [Allomuricauda oceani]MBW8244295.1 hypothetical protein [Allomuricauda oceani]QII44059.1 hypothetical protein GVT53_05025 [Allomuricauda oceani]
MRIKLTSVFTLSILTFFLWNCNGEKVSSKEFEQAVFYEIFPSIIDSIYFDKRLTPPPPPPPSYIDSNGTEIKFDSLQYKKAIENWKIRKEEIQKDTSAVYIVVSDSLSDYDREDFYELINHFKPHKIVLDSRNIELDDRFKIDLSKLNANKKKLKFKYSSEFPPGSEIWRTDYDYYIAFTISFSPILFDEKNEYGVLSGGYTRGRLNGSGFRIFIKRNDVGGWVIDEIVGTWIS